MKSIVVGLIAVLLVGATSRSEPPAKPVEIKKQFLAILGEYRLAKEEFVRKYKSVDGPEAQKLAADNTKRSKDVANRVLRLAQTAPEDPATCDVLTWIVTEPLGMISKEREAAFDLLRIHHVKSNGLIPAIKRANSFGRDFEAAESFLRAVVELNPDREVSGQARLSLAMLLKELALAATYLSQHPDAVKEHDPLLNAHAVDRLRSRKPEVWESEAENLLEAILDRYHDVQDGENKSLGDWAGHELFEIRHLAIGKVAPEIVGEDIDGKPMKLSDYRGKVVVLNFWSHRGCSVCRTLYPHDRSLVERLRGKPFALLGINCDAKREDVKAAMRDGQVTWRAWWDGDDTGSPIHDRWNIRGWPTIYVLDGKGVIRFRDV